MTEAALMEDLERLRACTDTNVLLQTADALIKRYAECLFTAKDAINEVYEVVEEVQSRDLSEEICVKVFEWRENLDRHLQGIEQARRSDGAKKGSEKIIVKNWKVPSSMVFEAQYYSDEKARTFSRSVMNDLAQLSKITPLQRGQELVLQNVHRRINQNRTKTKISQQRKFIGKIMLSDVHTALQDAKEHASSKRKPSVQDDGVDTGPSKRLKETESNTGLVDNASDIPTPPPEDGSSTPLLNLSATIRRGTPFDENNSDSPSILTPEVGRHGLAPSIQDNLADSTKPMLLSPPTTGDFAEDGSLMDPELTYDQEHLETPLEPDTSGAFAQTRIESSPCPKYESPGKSSERGLSPVLNLSLDSNDTPRGQDRTLREDKMLSAAERSSLPSLTSPQQQDQLAREKALETLQDDRMLSDTAIHLSLKPFSGLTCCILDPLWFAIDGTEWPSMPKLAPEKELCLIPLHSRTRSHWMLAILRPLDPSITYYDPLLVPLVPAQEDRLKKLGSKLIDHGTRTPQMEFNQSFDVQQQKTGFDCGVHVFLKAIYEITGSPAPKQHDCPLGRLHMRSIVRETEVEQETQPRPPTSLFPLHSDRVPEKVDIIKGLYRLESEAEEAWSVSQSVRDLLNHHEKLSNRRQLDCIEQLKKQQERHDVVECAFTKYKNMPSDMRTNDVTKFFNDKRRSEANAIEKSQKRCERMAGAMKALVAACHTADAVAEARHLIWQASRSKSEEFESSMRADILMMEEALSMREKP
ncbi:uncharacterized protein KY384_002842 [Bacidia gigantensis]|uniref:uncharacterized protein n=1 Tax=Bacidia gigantensis TaxID=2732470 RepID=UPI001D03B175|nr:uncharacterized protein KY384_002842 [Bacidia gigantensis]KAG8532357.1 hypothetical protein KY384_002842 [Bacidia gigantensis]